MTSEAQPWCGQRKLLHRNTFISFYFFEAVYITQMIVTKSSLCAPDRRCIRIAIVATAILVLSFAMASSLPVRSKRHSRYGRQGPHRHLEHFSSSSPGAGASAGDLPPTYNYHLRRPGQCRHDDQLFRTCFFCGRLIDEVRIYDGCCEMRDGFRRYCETLLA
jgi:hypothetical protein